MSRPTTAAKLLDASCVLERLEARAMLAAALWDGGGGDGDWANALNWDRGGADVVPQNGDDVTIVAAAEPAVTFSAAAGAVNLNSLSTTQNFVVSGGSLTVANAFSLNSVAFTYSGGTLIGSPVLTGGTLTLTPLATSALTIVTAGACTLSGGPNANQTVWVQGNNTVGAATLTFAAGVVNRGTIRLESIGANHECDLIAPDNGALTNGATGIIQVNLGVGGNRYIYGSVDNNGVISIQNGVALAVLGTNHVFNQNSGSITAAGNSTFYVHDGGIFNFNGGTLTGTVGISLAQLFIDPSAGASTVVVIGDGNTLLGANSSLTTIWVQGNNNVGAATLTFAAGVVNRGTIRLESIGANHECDLIAPDSGVLTNGATGVIQVNLGVGGNRYIYGSVDNNGIISIQNSVALAVLGTNQVFNQNSGSITAAGNSTFYVYNGGIFNFNGGTLTGTVGINLAQLSIGSSAGASTVVVIGNGNTLLGAQSSSATIWVQGNNNVGAATLTFAAGVMNRGTIRLESIGANYECDLIAPDNGVLTNGATGMIQVNLGVGGNRYIYGSVDNNGVISIQNSTALAVLGTNQVFNQNGGSITATGNSTFYVHNGGIFNFIGGTLTGTVGISLAQLFIGPSAGASTVAVVGNGNTLLGAQSTLTTIWVQGNNNMGAATLTFVAGVVNRGTIRLESIGANHECDLIAPDNGVLTNGATGVIQVNLGVGGNRYIYGSAVNTGTIRVVPGVALQISGDFSQQPTGNLSFIVDQPGIAGVINVNGTATLGGSLTMSFINQFTPVCSQSFTFLTATTQVGTFASVSTPAPPLGLQFVTLYTGNQVRVVASSIADINQDGFTNSADFFDFLTMFFTNDADFNGDGFTNSQDFFSYLTAFFNAC